MPAWLSTPGRVLELFVTVNLAFLALDIVLAHSVNEFGHWAEWLPLGYSLVGATVLAVGVFRGAAPHEPPASLRGLLVGWVGIAVGLSGMVWHLESRFFEQWTLQSLVYSAPFAAPLAFTGLGLLLLMNRMVADHAREWAGWVCFLALGGFVGNFALSLADHAQNGFFHAAEWVSVMVSALGVSTLAVLVAFDPGRAFRRFTAGVLGLQAVTGVVGFALHLGPLFSPSSAGWVDRVVYGPPLFAPLLFANLALLGGIGLWGFERVPGRAPDRSEGEVPAVATVREQA
ncbi:MAG TPA: hypothetical protein VK858_03365 [Longimicrobiales bacterium]|nr:hypothetical protein [Longimicrobiales bacterium]